MMGAVLVEMTMIVSIMGLCTGRQCRNKSDCKLAVHLVDVSIKWPEVVDKLNEQSALCRPKISSSSTISW